MCNDESDHLSSHRHAIILSHPRQDSFDHAIAKSYSEAVRAAGQAVVVRDLYALGFDPVLRAGEMSCVDGGAAADDVACEVAAIAGSDILVLIYPIWFGGPPAMIKGYIDRVLGAGVTPDAMQRREPTQLLGGRRLLSITTSAATDVWLDEQGQEQVLRGAFDRYLVHAFGMRSYEHLHIDHITSDLGKRTAAQHLLDVAKQARLACAQIAPARSPLATVFAAGDAR